jgi:hypothetical protein
MHVAKRIVNTLRGAVRDPEKVHCGGQLFTKVCTEIETLTLQARLQNIFVHGAEVTQIHFVHVYDPGEFREKAEWTGLFATMVYVRAKVPSGNL